MNGEIENFLIESIKPYMAICDERFGTKSKQLIESYGIIPNADEICETILNWFYGEVREDDSDNINNFANQHIFNKDNFFFRDALFQFIIGKEKRDAQYVSSEVKIIDNKLYYPIFNIWIDQKDIVYGRDNIKNTLYHEITHAYEDYRRLLNNDNSFRENYGKYSINLNMLLNSKNSLNHNLFNVLYILSKTELNAFLGQAYNEIKKLSKDIRNYKQYNKIYKRTEVYLNLFNAQISFMCLLREKDTKNRNMILQQANKILNIKFKNYHELLSFLDREIDKTLKYVNKKISKLMYKVFYIESIALTTRHGISMMECSDEDRVFFEQVMRGRLSLKDFLELD